MDSTEERMRVYEARDPGPFRVWTRKDVYDFARQEASQTADKIEEILDSQGSLEALRDLRSLATELRRGG